MQVVRHFADSAAAPTEERDPLKRIFFNMMKRYKTFVAELTKSRIVLDPDDPKAVADYKTSMDGVRKKVGAPTKTQKIGMILDREAEAAPDVKTFVKFIPKLKARLGVKDDTGGDQMMLEAVEKVEKKIGKTLTRQDAQGMALLKKEFEAINKKLGIHSGMIKDLEGEVEHAFAKEELQKMKDEVVEVIETHKKRHGLEDIKVDIKNLDHRNYM